jgi:hypothetical protein
MSEGASTEAKEQQGKALMNTHDSHLITFSPKPTIDRSYPFSQLIGPTLGRVNAANALRGFSFSTDDLPLCPDWFKILFTGWQDLAVQLQQINLSKGFKERLPPRPPLKNSCVVGDVVTKTLKEFGLSNRFKAVMADDLNKDLFVCKSILAKPKKKSQQCLVGRPDIWIINVETQKIARVINIELTPLNHTHYVQLLACVTGAALANFEVCFFFFDCDAIDFFNAKQFLLLLLPFVCTREFSQGTTWNVDEIPSQGNHQGGIRASTSPMGLLLNGHEYWMAQATGPNTWHVSDSISLPAHSDSSIGPDCVSRRFVSK